MRQRIKEITSAILSDYSCGFAYDDTWQVYDEIMRQFQLESPGHTEDELDLVETWVKAEVLLWLRQRCVSLPQECPFSLFSIGGNGSPWGYLRLDVSQGLPSGKGFHFTLGKERCSGAA